MSDFVFSTFLVEFKSGKTVHFASEDLQEVLDRCADEYPANVISSVYKEVYYNDEEND
jgi:hypothetical protein